jgi:hypothetical protein
MWKDVKRAITDNDSKWYTENDKDRDWEAPYVDIIICLKNGEWKIV